MSKCVGTFVCTMSWRLVVIQFTQLTRHDTNSCTNRHKFVFINVHIQTFWAFTTVLGKDRVIRTDGSG